MSSESLPVEDAELERLTSEMAKQASLGHKRFCVGVHEHEGGEQEWEWIDWSEAFRRLRSYLSADKRRLDQLEAALRDESAWTDFVISHDWEDGIWISKVERGTTLGMQSLDHSDKPLQSIRAAIDSAIQERKDV